MDIFEILGIFGYIRVYMAIYGYIRYIWVNKGIKWYKMVYLGIYGYRLFRQIKLVWNT